MLNPNALLWVEALESGKYTQCQSFLERCTLEGVTVGNCCLGVAIRVYEAAGHEVKTEVSSDNSRIFKTISEVGNAMLPLEVTEWLGLKTDSGCYYDEEGHSRHLTNDNDEHKLSFLEIAKIIRSEPTGLFV